MTERTIKLTLEELRGTLAFRQSFIITVNDNGAEIRRAAAPVVERDRSVVAYLDDRNSVVLSVEEQL